MSLERPGCLVLGDQGAASPSRSLLGREAGVAVRARRPPQSEPSLYVFMAGSGSSRLPQGLEFKSQCAKCIKATVASYPARWLPPETSSTSIAKAPALNSSKYNRIANPGTSE